MSVPQRMTALVHSGKPPFELRLATVTTPRIRPKEVLVRTAAIGVNRADIFQRRGNYPPPPGASEILGLEASGRVVAVGPEASGVSVGDPVMALLAGGAYAQYFAAHHQHVMRVPPSLSLVEAAAVPEAYATAYHALFAADRLQPGRSVLITAGASSLGLSAIHLAKRVPGVHVVATVRSPGKVEAVREEGADDVIVVGEGGWAALERTAQADQSGRYHLILDVVGSEGFEQRINMLHVDGTLLLLAALSGSGLSVSQHNRILGTLLMRRISIVGSTLRSRSDEFKAGIVSAFARDFAPYVRPRIYRVEHWSRANDLMRVLEACENVGKCVMVVSGDGDPPEDCIQDESGRITV